AAGGVLKWIIVIAVLALIAWYFFGQKGCGSTLNNGTTDTIANQGDTLLQNLKDDASGIGSASSGALNEAGDWVYDLGATTTLELADGTQMEVGQDSVEKRLVNFIEDDQQEIDDTQWFSLDRLYFETGKSTLKPESEQQLQNIAAIMKAYPNVKLK